MERLRHIREQAGYSQQDLANESGVSQHTISELELGRRQPQGRTLRKLAKVLGVEVADLREDTDSPKAEAPSSPAQQPLNGFEEERREAKVVTGRADLAGAGKLEATGQVIEKIRQIADELAGGKASSEAAQELEEQARKLRKFAA